MLEIDGREIDRLSIDIRTQTTQSQIVVVALLGGILMLATAVSALGLAYFSHRNSIEGKLLDTMQRAEQASEAKTAFLASMSHEIRTPLTGILGYTELLLQDRLAERHRRFVERIQSAASSLSAIVNDILDFSKIEAGEVAFESEHFSLSALIENVTSITHVIADKKGLLVKVALDPAIPDSLVGDKARLQQVLLNLLGNAVKFTARGHVSVAARYEGSSAAGEMIRIEVSDTGIGFPPEKRDLLFRRFSQLDGSIGREFGGTGLGLAISRQLIEMMGGQIGAESEPGVGSTFWITLCLDRSDANEAQPTESKARGSVVAGRVLLVEDSEQNQELVSTILRAAGHTVDIASDGLAAIDAVQSAPYDLILMDVQMRRLDGISAAKRIRALDHPACQVPIIALTANVLPQQVNSYREAGMNDFIAKPFTSKHLVASVSSWMQCEVAFPAVKDSIVTSENEHDVKSLEEIRELMGEDWVRASLRRLRDQINETFFDPNASPMDHVLLMGRAHLIVTSAAQLGFHALSRGCSELEECCSSGDGIDPSLMSARCFAQGAVKRIDELLAAAVPA
ncbi:MAG: ATP-binding protein [Acidiferrobacterales bacterium]|nr:ATP-binding protein [Acidiferrobacterales bacterium]